MDAVASCIAAPPSGGQPQPGGEDAFCGLPPSLLNPDGSVPEKLANLDPKLVVQIASEILEIGSSVTWDDIAGLTKMKSFVEEVIVWPLARPDLFQGLRNPPRSLLLFGPSCTGKTMIARAIASRGNCTFMNVSSSSLMSGDEKMVRCMFAVASVKQPTVIFFDEIDSLLSMRSENEMDAVRRVKTEFLVQFDAVGSSSADRIFIIGATNRPEELDEAARRRMEKRLYIPLPDTAARVVLLRRLMLQCAHDLTDVDFDAVAEKTAGFSGADVKLLARNASMAAADDNRPVSGGDFLAALNRTKPSVAPKEIERYAEFNRLFGSFNTNEEG